MPDHLCLNIRQLVFSILCWLVLLLMLPPAPLGADPTPEAATQAEETWSNPICISDCTDDWDARDADIAVCRDGTVHVVWEDDRGHIWHNWRTPGGSWQGPGPALLGGGVPARGREPAIAATSDCRVHMVWTQEWRGGTEIFISTWGGEGTWSISQNVSQTKEGQSGQPDIVITSTNEPRVVWVDTSTGGYHLFWGWPYRDVHWSSVPIEPPSLGQVPMLAVDKRDRLHLVWQCPELGRDLWAPPEICYRKRTESGKWSMWRENISNSPDADSRRPQIAIADDIPFVVWQETVADDEEIYASRRIDGDWTPADNVSSTHGRSKAPAMAVDVTGSVHVAWDEEESTDLVFTRTWLVSNEDWREHDTVSNGGSRVRDVAIAASSTSTKVYLVWSETGPSEKWDIYFSEFDSLPHHFYLALISR